MYSDVVLQQVITRYETRSHLKRGFVHYYEVEVPNGVVAVLGGFGVGGPAAARTMEEIVAAGVTSVVSIGGAGGLDSDLNVGDLVICDGAMRDEGVSYHYLPPDWRYVAPDRTLTERLRIAVEQRTSVVRVGKTWTIDAIYRETREEVRRYRDEGVLTVEMEAASLAAVAVYRGVAFATAFAIMDLLGTDAWRPEGFGHRDALDGLLLLFDAAAAVLSSA